MLRLYAVRPCRAPLPVDPGPDPSMFTPFAPLRRRAAGAAAAAAAAAAAVVAAAAP